jgi:hypothetical protein
MPDLVRSLTALFALFLSLVALLGGTTGTPTVPIGQLPLLDRYSEVRIEGMLVDLWERDDGSEVLVLLDASAGATAKVFSACGVASQPSSYAFIGDVLRITGELGSSSPSPTIYARSDGISLVTHAGQVMSVTILSRYWRLLEGDRFELAGTLAFDESSGSARLFDSSRSRSIALRCDTPLGILADKDVIVKGILRFDSNHMSLFIEVESVSEAVR